MKTTTTYGVIITLFLFFYSLTSFSQETYWKKADKNSILTQKKATYKREHFPSKYDLYSLDVSALTNQLKSKGNTIYLPNTNGQLVKYLVKETSNLDPALANKFPMIKSYSAQAIDDPTATAKISMGTDGFHAVIVSGSEGEIYIDPYTKDNKEYLVYKTSNLEGDFSFNCDVEEVAEKHVEDKPTKSSITHDGKLRIYRIAIVGSGEYSEYHLRNQGVPATATDLEKKVAVLSVINTTMTRVNAIFERDISVRMVLVANNDDIIFLDPNTDGVDYTHTFSMNNSSRVICNEVIGAENYDMGHIFGAANRGGQAGLNVCNSRKAHAVSSATADYLFVSIVAHEIGHHFQANHTMSNQCAGYIFFNRVEPGGGSTLMGYADACYPSPQARNDHYFHINSIRKMWDFIQSDNATCGTEVDTGNTPPVIVNAGLPNNDSRDYIVIPRSTPFVLKGSATDVNGTEGLTYTWEQTDIAISQSPIPMPPLSTNTVGPMFRSLPPTTSPNRYMPALATVVAGETSSTWEVVPSVSRGMLFTFTARDNHSGAGSFASRNVTVRVDNSTGPFRVTSQSNNVLWNAGAQKEITWDVAGTTNTGANSPNAQTVNILLSTDGGQTFPITLASAVPNDGSHAITVPQIGENTDRARVMVEANDNVFYAVNSSNFRVEEHDFFLEFINGTTVNVCSSDVGARFSFIYRTPAMPRFTRFSVTGLPTGAEVMYDSSNTLAYLDGNQIDFTIAIKNIGIGRIFPGSYPFKIHGVSANEIRAFDMVLNVYNAQPATTLVAPLNGETNTNLIPELRWTNNGDVASYDLEVATDINFNLIVLEEEDITDNFFVFSENYLNENTTYYWRVKPKNLCAEGNFSSASSFTTSCRMCKSVGNAAYDAGTNRVVFNTIDNSSTIEAGYNDYQNISTNVIRGNTYNLSVQVTAVDDIEIQTIVWIDWNQDCIFDQENESYHLGSAVNVINGLTDRNPLGIRVPANAKLGRTTMRVTTKNDSDLSPCENDFFGEVEDYSIVVQDASASHQDNPVVSIEDFIFEGFDLYPNPTQGMFIVRFKTVSEENVSLKVMDLFGRTVFANDYKNVSSNFSERIVLENISSGVYLLQIQNGGKQTTKKLLIE